MIVPARDHEQWADSLGAWLLGALPEDEAAGFKRHLDECAVCREDAVGLQVAVDALPASAAPHSPPAALKGRIMAVVEGEAELLQAAGPESDRPHRRRSWFGGLSWRPALALGLAALAIGFVGSQALQSGGPEKITAQVQSGGQATLEVQDGQGRLVASHLPDPPNGRVYQVWLDKGGKTPEPTNVLFTTSNDGTATADVPSLDGVKRVMVTDEPSGGSRSPTGKVLLTASV
jgi:Anti-sigma-K factor rskA/Putative zinc-finger